MMNDQFKNTRTVLSELLESIQKMGDAVDIYFDRLGDGEILNPFLTDGKTNTIGKNEALPPAFFQGFGIRNLILDSSHGRLSLSEKDFIDLINKNGGSFKWRELKGELIMEDLQMLFKNSQIVEFANWSDVGNASEIWDNLLREVIRTSRRNDFDFIFYPGDTEKKLSFEVDEFLDIVCGYSGYGRVTLVLDERNVDNLWAMFFGRDARTEKSVSPGLNEKCRSVFDLVNIEHLLVGSYSDAHFFSNHQQFEIEYRRGFEISKNRRPQFNSGYVLGLLLKVDISQAIALGLAMAGLYSETENKQDSKNLIGYIEKWIGELESLKPADNQLVIA